VGIMAGMVRTGCELPLRGGLPPVDAAAGVIVEIACDESGFSGTNLLDPATPVITHASVDLSAGEAAGLIAALQSGFQYSPNEFKSGQFLRGPGAREALEWFLAARAAGTSTWSTRSSSSSPGSSTCCWPSRPTAPVPA
jgi:hypothetical protein